MGISWRRLMQSFSEHWFDVLAILAAVYLALILGRGAMGCIPSTETDFHLGMAGVIVALLSVYAAMKAWRGNRRSKESSSYTAQVIRGWKEAASILKNAGADRVKWLAAARIISGCNSLRNSVRERADLDSLGIEVAIIREEMWELLTRPGSFYLGFPSFNHMKDAIEQHRRAGSVCEIPVYAIYAVYSLVMYPEDWKDPLPKNADLNVKSFTGLGRESAGLKEYVKYMDSRN